MIFHTSTSQPRLSSTRIGHDRNKISKTRINISRVVDRSVTSYTRIQAFEIQGQRANISIIRHSHCTHLREDPRYPKNGMSTGQTGVNIDSSTKNVLRQHASRMKGRQQTANRREDTYDQLQYRPMESITLEVNIILKYETNQEH